MVLFASSEHRSTHMSFAAVYTKGIDRESVFEGLRARRTYAATDKLLLDFSIGKHIMGEEIAPAGTPELPEGVDGPGPNAESDVIKNSKNVYTVRPCLPRAD